MIGKRIYSYSIVEVGAVFEIFLLLPLFDKNFHFYEFGDLNLHVFKTFWLIDLEVWLSNE